MSEAPPNMSLDRLIATAPLLVAIADSGSFVGAAERLGIDPSAVSHRIRFLEKALGLRLFERTTRSVRPTRSGALLCDAARRAVADFDRAVESARQIRVASTLRLSASSSVAMKWLVPRLPAAADAGLDLSVEVSEELANLDHGGVDAALRFGVGPYPGLHATRLTRCDLQPVIAARLARRGGSIDPLAADGLPLLGDRGSGRWQGLVAWEEYARRLGRTVDPACVRRDFDRADVMLQAAIAGLGIALGRTLLIEDDTRIGLLSPVGQPTRTDASYWLVTSHEQVGNERIAGLIQWLKQTLAATGLPIQSV